MYIYSIYLFSLFLGVIAEAHYDDGRNMVAMIKGRKRYVLLPPRACKSLYLLPRGHPSARHSYLDWSNITEVLAHPGNTNDSVFDMDMR